MIKASVLAVRCAFAATHQSIRERLAASFVHYRELGVSEGTVSERDWPVAYGTSSVEFRRL